MAAPHSRNKRRRDTRPLQRAMRAQDSRVVQAIKSARDQEAALERRIRWEQAQEEVRAAQRAQQSALAAEQAAVERRLAAAFAAERAEQEKERKRQRWPLGAARSMYRQGYTLEHCIAATGWDASDFEGALEVQAILDGTS